MWLSATRPSAPCCGRTRTDGATSTSTLLLLWPPLLYAAVAQASYVEGHTSSRVRLFNLSPDTKVAGMSMGGTVLAVRKNEI